MFAGHSSARLQSCRQRGSQCQEEAERADQLQGNIWSLAVCQLGQWDWVRQIRGTVISDNQYVPDQQRVQNSAMKNNHEITNLETSYPEIKLGWTLSVWNMKMCFCCKNLILSCKKFEVTQLLLNIFTIFSISGAMGAAISSQNDLAKNDHLNRLVSKEVLSPSDPFWNSLLSFNFMQPRSK